MGIEKILSKIREETDREIEEILSQARREKNEKIESARRDIEKEIERFIGEQSRKIENKKRAEIAKIRQEIRRDILHKKEEMIESCINRAIESLRGMSRERYLNFVESLMREVAEEIGDDCIIIPSKEEDKIVAKKLGLKVDRRKVDAVGGFIAKSKDGSTVINNTFEEILKRKERSIRMKIGNILFGAEVQI